MKIDIRKYRYRDGGQKNYFDNPVFVDRLNLTEIHEDGFPLFNEEHEDENESFILMASEFNVKFSLLQENISLTGKTIEDFFKYDIADHCIVVKIELDEKIIGGMIDLTRIVLNYSFPERYDVQFSIFGFEEEFQKFVQGSPTTPSYILNTFSSYIGGARGFQNGMPFFRATSGEILPTYFRFDFSHLNWIQRCGYEPVLCHEVWAELISAGAIPSNCTCWTLFEDLCKGFGIIYKLSIDSQDVGNYFKVKMYLGFRNTGFSNMTVAIELLDHEQGYKVDENVNEVQIFKFGKAVGSGNTDPDESVFYGLVFDKTRNVTIDGAIFYAYGWNEEYIAGNNDGVLLNEIRSTFPAFIGNEPINTVEFNHYIKAAAYVQHITIPGWRYYVFATPMEANNSDTFSILRRKAYPFPRFWTKAGYSINTSRYRFFDAHDVVYIDNAGSQNTHDLWYSLVQSTTYPCYTYLLNSFKRVLRAKANLMNSYNLNLFDKTVVGDYEYVLQRIRNLDLDKRNTDTEWFESRNIKGRR